MKRLLLLTALLCALASPLACQVPVAQAPPIKFQFFSNAGLPLAAGCLTTFQAGTSNLAATYTESTGTSLNTNPIILDGAGRADIFLPNAAFKFTMKSAGGVNCSTGSTLWTVDGITGVLGLLNLNNIWTGTNQFNQAITIAVNSNQIVAGLPGAQTTLNFPAPAGNVTLNFPSTADTMVGRATTDTLTNKTLTAPVLSGAANNSLVCTNGSAALTTSGCAAASNLTAQQANIGATTLLTPSANGFYRFSCYIVITQAATTSSTTPSCAIAWTDADTSAVLAATLLQTNTANVAGNVSVESSNTLRNVFAKSGTAITFNTANYASVGATPMQYAIHVRLEGPF